MGFFSKIASEARRDMAYEQAPTFAQQTNIPLPTAPQPSPTPPVTTEAPVAQPVPAPEVPSAPDEHKQEPVAVPAPLVQQAATPTLDLSAEADVADEAERKRAHEEAEAKRKAEFDARQAARKAAEKEQLDRLAAMDDEAAIAAAVNQVTDATDKMTNRSMKDSVAAHLQVLCRADPAFARLTMHPRKSMLHCIQYIFRQAKDYLEKELKAGGIKVSGTYGGDVPDGLCFQWAEDYFRDPNAKEDSKDDEKFVPHTYTPPPRRTSKTKATKKKPEQEKPAAEKPQAPALEQMSLI